MNADGDQEYLADGIAEEILNLLAAAMRHAGDERVLAMLQAYAMADP